MAMLSKEDIASYAFKTGHIFSYMCDEDGCGRLLKANDPFTVLKWGKRSDKLTFLSPPILKLRCRSCTTALHPQKEVVAVKGAGRTAKKVSQEQASNIAINVIVRRFAVNLIKRAEAGLTKIELFSRLQKKKAIREIKRKEINATVRNLKKLKVIRFTGGKFLLPKEKKSKIKKAKSRKIKVK